MSFYAKKREQRKEFHSMQDMKEKQKNECIEEYLADTENSNVLKRKYAERQLVKIAKRNSTQSDPRLDPYRSRPIKSEPPQIKQEPSSDSESNEEQIKRKEIVDLCDSDNDNDKNSVNLQLPENNDNQPQNNTNNRNNGRNRNHRNNRNHPINNNFHQLPTNSYNHPPRVHQHQHQYQHHHHNNNRNNNQMLQQRQNPHYPNSSLLNNLNNNNNHNHNKENVNGNYPNSNSMGNSVDAQFLFEMNQNMNTNNNMSFPPRDRFNINNIPEMKNVIQQIMDQESNSNSTNPQKKLIMDTKKLEEIFIALSKIQNEKSLNSSKPSIEEMYLPRQLPKGYPSFKREISRFQQDDHTDDDYRKCGRCHLREVDKFSIKKHTVNGIEYYKCCGYCLGRNRILERERKAASVANNECIDCQGTFIFRTI